MELRKYGQAGDDLWDGISFLQFDIVIRCADESFEMSGFFLRKSTKNLYRILDMVDFVVSYYFEISIKAITGACDFKLIKRV